MYYYKFNIADWHLATSHLSLEEEAIYFRLINYYYDTEQAIPEETQSVIRRLRLGSYSEIVGIILKEFFTLESDGWHHKRCDDEISQYHDKAEVNQINGKKGGRPKKTQTVSKDNPDITLTKNHKPLTINHNIYTDSFNEFWKVYPRHESKKESAQAFSKVTESLEVLIKAVKEQTIAKAWDKPENKQFVPHAATWLNQRRWEDEVVQEAPVNKLLPLGTDKQIAYAYEVECGGDPTKARFNSYFEMRKFIEDFRDKQKRAAQETM